MKSIMLGAAGFIGKNLALRLAQDREQELTLVDRSSAFFADVRKLLPPEVKIREEAFTGQTDFDSLLAGQDTVYHLVSTTAPATSNRQVSGELKANVIVTAELLEACVRCRVKRVVFFSSGGTVYGPGVRCPIPEEAQTEPVCSYGLQKLTIEKLLHLYWCMYGLDYRILRLSNPYGPYQRPDGILGAVTTFTYRALKGEEITVYGDGSVVRDFIYIDDAVEAAVRIARDEGIRGVRRAEGKQSRRSGSKERIFNVGCGYGTSITEVLETIGEVLHKKLKVSYRPGRPVDVPENYLDITRYESRYGRLLPVPLEEGIRRTADFMRKP